MERIVTGNQELLSYSREDFMSCKARIVCDFYDVDYKHFTFNGGEEHVKILEPRDVAGEDVMIIYNIRKSKDIMTLLIMTDAVRRCSPNSIELYIPYLPYARQDRVCCPGEALSIKVFADLINSQNYRAVTIVDPHSDVSTALINNVIVIEQHDIACRVIEKGDIIVSPDAGSLKKCYKLAQITGNHVIAAEKVRDVRTGEIIRTDIRCGDITGQNVIIIDDICDGGATFIALARELKKFNVGKIKLYVTHGIFSKGVQVFEDIIDKIYTTNSFYEEVSNDKIEVVPIE